MAYSNKLRLQTITDGDKAGLWGDITNKNIGTLLEEAIAGAATVVVASAAQALTATATDPPTTDEARQAVILLTGTPGAAYAIYVPPQTKLYVIKNSITTYTATIYCSTVLGNTTAAGTGIAIPSGFTAFVRSDGTNILSAVDYLISPTLVTPALGTPASGVATNLTGTAASLTAGTASAVAVGGVTGLGTGVATALAINVGTAGSPVVNGGALGTPSSGVATSLTGTAAGLTAGTASAVAVGGITGLGAGIATFLATPSSTNFAAAVTGEQGTGAVVFADSPSLTTPTLGVATATSVNKWTLTAPTTAATLTSGADSCVYTMPGETASIGYKNIPQNTQAGATYTPVLLDSGKHIYVTATQTITIPTNASVAFAIGTAITIVNNTAAVTTFTTTSLTVYKAGTSAAWASGGTLAIRGICTWLKVNTDTWFVNGTGLS